MKKQMLMYKKGMIFKYLYLFGTTKCVCMKLDGKYLVDTLLYQLLSYSVICYVDFSVSV